MISISDTPQVYGGIKARIKWTSYQTITERKLEAFGDSEYILLDRYPPIFLRFRELQEAATALNMTLEKHWDTMRIPKIPWGQSLYLHLTYTPHSGM